MDEISAPLRDLPRTCMHMRSISTNPSSNTDQNQLGLRTVHSIVNRSYCIQKLRMFTAVLKRDRLRTENRSTENKVLLVLIGICTDLINKKNANAKLKILTIKQKYNGNPMIKAHLDALDHIVDTIEHLPEHSKPKNGIDINIDSAAVDSMKKIAGKNIVHRRQVSEFSLSDHKQEFYAHFLAIKIRLSERHPGYMCCIEDIYNEAMEKQVPRKLWPTFIQEHFDRMNF